MSEDAPPVSVEGLEKEYRSLLGRRRHLAVRGVGFEVPRGSVTALVGPNGGGKTTTLKCLLGLLRPSAGRVAIFGRPPTDPSARARLGYCPEESPFPGFLGLDAALGFFAELAGVPRRERAARCGALLERVGLLAARARRIRELSKGMLRRFGIAQALVGAPDLLVLDEPTSGLDPLGVRDVRAILDEERRRGAAVLLSSHLLADVEKIADRLLLMHEGRLVARGTLDELLGPPREEGGGRAEPLERFFFRRVEEGAGGA
jgi:ABC-2 type transport system ATP-binding protein